MAVVEEQAAKPDPVGLLRRALDQAGSLIAAARPEQATAPTPCRSWNLGRLIGHVLHDLEAFEEMARGGKWRPGSAEVPPDKWDSLFEERAQKLLAAWQTLDLEDPASHARLDQQITEFALHAWDIARATAQPKPLDHGVAEYALWWLRQNLKPQFRGEESGGTGFGFEQRAPDGAPAADQLAAFSGRPV